MVTSIKKIALSLLVVGLAIGFSAFKTVKPLSTIYYNIGNDEYSLTPPDGTTCRPVDDNPCTIQFEGDISSAYPTFELGDIDEVSNNGGGDYEMDQQDGAYVLAP